MAIETETGPANFVGIYAEGDEAALQRFKAAADALRFRAFGPSVGLMKRVRVTVTFETRRDRQGTTNAREAQAFLARAQHGEFGPLNVRPLISPIDTLTRYGC